jgi:hypothetical protein
MSTPGNILAPDDADFEGATTGWRRSAPAGAFLRIFTDLAADGSQSAGLETGDPVPSPNYISPPFACTAGVQYHLGIKIWHATSTPASVGVGVEWYDSGGVLLDQASVATSAAASTWVLRTLDSTAPAGAVTGIMRAQIGRRTGEATAAIGRHAIDTAYVVPDVSIAEMTSTSPIDAEASATPAAEASMDSASPVSATGAAVLYGDATEGSTSDISATAKATAVASATTASESAVSAEARFAALGGATVGSESVISARPALPDVPTARVMPPTWIEAAVGHPSTYVPARHEWVRLDNDGACVRRLEVHQGREQRVGEIEPGEATILLADPEGKLDPSNTQSPLWAGVRPGVDYRTRVRIRLWSQQPALYEDIAATYTSYADLAGSAATYADLQPADDRVLFAGFVDRLQPDYVLDDATAELELVDVLSLLADLPTPTSPIAAEMQKFRQLRHLYPMTPTGVVIKDIGPGAVDGSWASAPNVGGTVSRFEATPTAEITGGIPEGTIVGVNLSGNWMIQLAFTWTGVSDGGGAGNPHRPILQLAGTGLDRLMVWLNTSPTFTGFPVSNVFSETPPGGGGSDAVGNAMPDVPNLLKLWRWNGVIRATLNDDAFGVTCDGGGNAYDTIVLAGTFSEVGYTRSITGSLSWLSVSTFDPASPTDTGELPSHDRGPDMYDPLFAPWVDDTDDRVARITAAAGYPAEIESGSWSNLGPIDLTVNESSFDHIRRAAAGDRAIITVNDDGQPLLVPSPALGSPAVWFDTSGFVGVPIRDAKRVYGVDRLATVVRVEYGKEAYAVADDPDSVYGIRELPIRTMLADPADAEDLANQILSERRAPRDLITAVVLEGRDARVPWPALSLKQGDVVGAILRPPNREPLVQVSIVERIDHEQGDGSWRIVYGLDRLVQYLTWQDVIDLYATWADLIADKAVWSDVLASASAFPPGA